MKKLKTSLALLALIALALSMSMSTLPRVVRAHDGDIPKLTYPETKRVDVVDTYFGTAVPDPYRWLEDDNAPEVAAWVEAENKVTFGYLDKIAYRPQLKDRLTKLLNYPKFSAPTRRGENFIFSKNDGLQNQSVFYIQKGLDGTPELLLDPNKFSADGTSQLGGFALSESGKYVAYGISEGGSDWRDYYVLDVAAKKPLADHLEWVKFSGASWRGEDGFYYNRYPVPPAGKKMSTKNDFQKIYYH
jgi:prolyl oligopeptidase